MNETGRTATEADAAAPGPSLETERLVLRRWSHADLEPFSALNADPRVMEHFPSPLTPEESAAFVGRIEDAFRRRGFGLWAVERRDTGVFIGFVGLTVPGFEAHFSSVQAPAVEVGWRLAADEWGQGFATEAASAVLGFAFEVLGLAEVVSMTAVGNERSMRVMERLGMRHDPADDFEHPNVPVGSPLARHVLYRLDRDGWSNRAR
ncbi:GNAT family N-acetyltransferase [Luethyella okanaganae]|uniref:GNAT family N-acetyltransferase n=1 Tax=Luethyella okanaganae TaxID=69372 RepID=A0ABW1VCE6_9MICO